MAEKYIITLPLTRSTYCDEKVLSVIHQAGMMQ